MRAEMLIATAVQFCTYAAAVEADAPAITIKLIAIFSGCSLGAVAGAFAAPRASVAQRWRRFVVSMCAGIVLAVIALAMLPAHASFQAHEWIAVVSAGSAFFGYWVVAKLDERGEGFADAAISRAASKVGLDGTNGDRQ